MTMCSFAFRPVLAAAALGVCVMLGSAAHAGGIEVKDAWIGLAPPVMKVHAGYFTLTNTGSAERHLVAVESSAYASAMLHVSREVNGVATMEHVQRVTLGPGKSVTFAPGGLHVMLMGPREKQVDGATVPVVFVFEDGEKLPATATIRKSASDAGNSDHGGHAAHQHKGM